MYGCVIALESYCVVLWISVFIFRCWWLVVGGRGEGRGEGEGEEGIHCVVLVLERVGWLCTSSRIGCM